MLSSHIWLTGGRPSDRAAALNDLVPSAPLSRVSADRRLRGPYTGAGELARDLVSQLAGSHPELLARHHVVLRAVAPELAPILPAQETLTSMAIQRSRYYAMTWTLRLAHGFCEFLRDVAAAAGCPLTIVVEDADRADATDIELLAVLLRRSAPDAVQVVVGSTNDPADALVDALTTYARQAKPPRLPLPDLAAAAPTDLAREYVDGDCRSDDPRLIEAYDRLSAPERAALHDARAAELVEQGQFSLRLGAIPFHLERGSAAGSSGVTALKEAATYCLERGYYRAAVELGKRGRALAGWSEDPHQCWVFTLKMTAALSILGDAERAEALYDEAREHSRDPMVQQQAAYATAMIYARHHDPQRRDFRAAKRWINMAIVLSELITDPQLRAYTMVFNRNGLALVESRLGRPDVALDLVSGGIEELEITRGASNHAELESVITELHSVMQHNRAQVFIATGRLTDALAELTAIVQGDPNYDEYHFERGNVLRQLGRVEDAIADYETVMRLGPPFPEVYYNRGDARLEVGAPGAEADFDYVLELDPDFVDAYVNRAALRLDRGDVDGAFADVRNGLHRQPDNPHLHALLGQLHLAEGRPAEAIESLTRAVTVDPGLGSAWAVRGAVHFERGDLRAALDDLTRSIEVDDNPTVRLNRSLVWQALGRWREATEDLATALDIPGALDAAESREATARLECCRRQLGSRA